MGTSFFHSGGAPKILDKGQNLEARAIGANSYAGRGAGILSQKDVGAAQAINKAAIAMHGPLKRSAAYPKGPKV